MEGRQGGSKWNSGLGKDSPCRDFLYIHLMRMAEELEVAQLEFNRKGVCDGHFSMLMMMFCWQSQGQSGRLCWMWLRHIYQGGR